MTQLTIDGLRELFIERLSLDLTPEEFGAEDSLVEDLGLDSVDLLEVAIGIEKGYGIKVTQEDTEAFANLTTLYEFCVARESARETADIA